MLKADPGKEYAPKDELSRPDMLTKQIGRPRCTWKSARLEELGVRGDIDFE